MAFQEEVQTLRLQSAPFNPTVRVVTTSATPAAEIQFVVVTPGSGSVTGTFTLTLRGLTTGPISYAATLGTVQTAIQALGACTSYFLLLSFPFFSSSLHFQTAKPKKAAAPCL